MNGIAEIVQNTRALQTLCKAIRPTTSVVASAFFAALIAVPCSTIAASGDDAATMSSARAPAKQSAGAQDARIRSFRINVPTADLTDLRKRLAATRWPSKELVGDRSQGVQLATLKELARYWEKDYDGARRRPGSMRIRSS